MAWELAAKAAQESTVNDQEGYHIDGDSASAEEKPAPQIPPSFLGLFLTGSLPNRSEQ